MTTPNTTAGAIILASLAFPAMAQQPTPGAAMPMPMPPGQMPVSRKSVGLIAEMVGAVGLEPTTR